MTSCHNCGSSVEDGVITCPFCGSKIDLEEMLVQPSEIDEETIEIVIKQKSSQIVEEEQDGESVILHTPDIEEMEFLEDEEQIVTQTLEIIPERNYIYWALLGIISVGIIFLIYLFINISDLEKHSHYPKDSRAEAINVNTSQTLLFFLIAICFGFIPVLWWIYHKKYSSLYFHLRNQKNDTAPLKIPHPIFYLLPLMSSHIFAIIPSLVGFITQKDIRFEMPVLFWSFLGCVLFLSLIPLVLDYLWQRAFNAHIRTTMARLQITGKIQEKTVEKGL